MRRTNIGPCQRSEAGTNDHRGEVPGRTCQRLSMSGAIRLNMKIVIAGSGLFADGSLQSNEFVPGADCFGRQVTPVVGIDRRLERNASGDLDTRLNETVELGWIVGKQHDSRTVQGSQHHCRSSIVALVVLETQHRVGVAGIEPRVLQSIGPHLVRKTNTATFLGQVQNNATTDAFQARQRELKLVATVASSRAKHVACQACRMKPNRDRLTKIWVANDDSDLIDAESVTKHNKAGGCARCERN